MEVNVLCPAIKMMPQIKTLIHLSELICLKVHGLDKLI